MTAPPLDLAPLVATLCQTHGAHTALLYGSLADGSAGPDSDIDLALFAPVDEVRRDARWHQGRALDVFIHPERALGQPDATWLYLRGAQVLAQRGDEAGRFLAALDTLHAAGPTALAGDEARARRVWAEKMLQRLQRGDAEGDYRRHWLLMMALEDYFALRGRWYPGPKKALAWLAREAPAHHRLCAQALRPDADVAAIAAWVAAVNDDTPGA